MSVAGVHVEGVGDGAPVVLVHGSFGTARGSFAAQLPLADSYRLLLLDRRGFGSSPRAEDVGWKTDADDLITLLDEVGPAHLLGHSYGAVACLLAAGLRPESVRSLVAIEPPLFEAAKGDPDADRVGEQSRAVAQRAGALAIEDFMREWGASVGQSRFEVAAWTAGFSQPEWDAAESSRRERWPGDAPVDFPALAAAAFPRVLAHGGWNPEVVGHKARVGAAFAAVCRSIAEATGADVERFPDSTHNPQSEEPAAFNALLRRVWDAA